LSLPGVPDAVPRGRPASVPAVAVIASLPPVSHPPLRPASVAPLPPLEAKSVYSVGVFVASPIPRDETELGDAARVEPGPSAKPVQAAAAAQRADPPSERDALLGRLRVRAMALDPAEVKRILAQRRRS
jgi:hypothetical protein